MAEGPVRHSDRRFTDVPVEFAAMVVRLEELSRAHVSLDPVDLGSDPPWVADVLDHHRQTDVFRRQLVELRRTQAALQSDHVDLVARMGGLDDANLQLSNDHIADHEELSRLQSELTRLQSDVTAISQERDAARTHAERVDLELERIRSSRSWKVTAPLRWNGGRSIPDGRRGP